MCIGSKQMNQTIFFSNQCQQFQNHFKASVSREWEKGEKEKEGDTLIKPKWIKKETKKEQ